MTHLKHKSYRFSLKPNETQKVLLEKHFGCSRFIYNTLLTEKKEHYLENKKTLSYHKGCSKITEWKTKFKWLNEVNSQTLQQSAKDLETAYTRFFKKHSNFPKYKKKGNRDSFRCPQFVEIRGRKLHVPKFKQGIQIQLHRKINGQIKSCTISKTPSGKYFVSILCREYINELPKTNREVGIDLGIKDFIITSDNQKFDNPKLTKKYEKILSKNQKHLSRKTKGSNRYNKQRIKVAKIHEKITNSRNDHHHKLSKLLVDTYDLICIEDLSVKNMYKTKTLSKSIQDCSWNIFTYMLNYKCDYYGKTLVKIDRFFPSSKTCSNCNHINHDLTLKNRSWVCKHCNTTHDRDINAAKNIYRQGLSITNMEKEALTNNITIVGETTFNEVFKKKIHNESEAHKSLARV